ncbi:MAG: hypothetical protein LBF89_03405 [Bacteroidales bacterium]|jgi:hypothetical protein|nr:hypothetical protein [Bacteroidales bacterium]
MKKILFVLFLVLCVRALAYDTLFLKPHEAVIIELNVDTGKYPALEGEAGSVLWCNPQGRYMTGPDMGLYRTPGRTFYFDGDADGARLNGYFWYQFAIVMAPGKWSVVRDTVKFVHVWSRPDITGFTLNGVQDVSVRRGESITVNVEVSDSLNVDYMYLLNSVRDSLFPVYDGYSIDWSTIEEEHLFHALYVVAVNPCFRDTTTVARNVSFDPTGNGVVGLRPKIYAAGGRVYMDAGVRYVIYDMSGSLVASGVYTHPIALSPGIYVVNGVKVAL